MLASRVRSAGPPPLGPAAGRPFEGRAVTARGGPGGARNGTRAHRTLGSVSTEHTDRAEPDAPSQEAPGPSAAITDRRVLEYVERIAAHFTAQGLPLIAARILGWLLVCDPAEQTAGQIATAIGASKGSLSTNLRLLHQMRLVTRVTRPGERVVRHTVAVGLWYERGRRAIATLTDGTALLAQGIDLLGAEAPRARRLVEAHAVHADLDRELQAVWARWEARWGRR